MDVNHTETLEAQPDGEPAVTLERAEQHDNPFLEVFETGRRLHARLDHGDRWLILDFGSGPPPLADVAMAFALVRAGRRAVRAGGGLVVIVADERLAREMRAAEPATAGLDIVATPALAHERIEALRHPVGAVR